MADPSDPTQDVPTAGPADERARAYRVLARKYRPQSFVDLIGQEPMVQTIRNGFERNRIPQAWMLTGVRGVGKTTTARILARALNYAVPGEFDTPTVDFPKIGLHCDAILESRHVDVIEMDAASHTGIADIREIIDASRYMPASARYKVYIIDEVHMLSRAAFNGLLKTLEEPPAHVKFIFATTEIRKVPVTVLSRCQRFDLRRIEPDMLISHLEMIAKAEEVGAERDALGLIARAAEGSVRDALSLLDQAIAHGAGSVTTDNVTDMLGLVDRGLVVDLFETVMKGDVSSALDGLGNLYAQGAEPVTVLEDLAAISHQLTQAKFVDGGLADAGYAAGLVTRMKAMADDLSVGHLSRAWQILLKGIDETATAPRPIAAADMVVVRLAHAAGMPPPDAILKKLRDGAGLDAGKPAVPRADDAKPAPSPVSQSSIDNAPVASIPSEPLPRLTAPPQVLALPGNPMPESFEAVVDLVREKRDGQLTVWLERSVRLVAFEPGRITLAPVGSGDGNLIGSLAQKLHDWTGRRWMVASAAAEKAQTPTIHEQKQAEQAQMIEEARSDDAVASVFEHFPGAEILKVELLENPSESAEETDDAPQSAPSAKE